MKRTKTTDSKPSVAAERREELLEILEARFEKNAHRHTKLIWTAIRKRLEAEPRKLWALNEMETTGDEPDVVGYDKATDEYLFFDCSKETPQADGVSATTARPWSPESNTLRRAARWTWRTPWASIC